ncbi:MAG TPA: hypothetical protein VE397_22510, partial [Stellaceae bacterium]|nr:hypothetical protein [Stellaceae bacterium]
MAVGSATLSGGDTVSFTLDSQQIAAVQQAIRNLETAHGFTSDQVRTTIGSFASPSAENVLNLAGGTTVNVLPAYTSEIILDSVNGSVATTINVSAPTPLLIVGNQGND